MKKTHNNTSENVLKIIKFILKKEEFTIAEIISYLSDLNISVEQETVLKYIRTMKKMGFEFEKTSARVYKLLSIPILLSNYEINTLEKILKVANDNLYLPNSKITEKFLLFFPASTRSKVLFYLDKNHRSKLQELTKYIKDNLRLELYLKNQTPKTVFELHDFYLDKENIFLKGYNVTEKTPAIYNYEKISQISQTPTKNRFLFGDKEAIIKFYSRMSKTYTIKDGEQVIRKSGDCSVIKTNYYDEEAFFKKILRYADHCEILQPLYLREKFVEYVRKLYQMYDCNIDK